MALVDELTTKITHDGEVEAKAYVKYVEWCDEVSQNGAYSIDTASKEKAKLEASIQELNSGIDTATSKIGDLVSAVSTAETEVKDAGLIRDKESADFAASEKELTETIDALTRAVGFLEKEMAKNPAAFAQINSASLTGVVQGLSAVLEAASFSNSDTKKLAALVQSQQQSGDAADDEGLGEPAAATYKTHSSGILDVLEDVKEKAEGQLSELRKSEVNTRHNFDLLKQSLEDQTAADTKHMKEEKAGKAEAEEKKAGAQGDLDVTSKELASSEKQLATARGTCLQIAADHEATVAARKEELKVITEARRVLTETSSGAVAQTYSFVQVARMRTSADLAGK